MVDRTRRQERKNFIPRHCKAEHTPPGRWAFCFKLPTCQHFLGPGGAPYWSTYQHRKQCVQVSYLWRGNCPTSPPKVLAIPSARWVRDARGRTTLLSRWKSFHEPEGSWRTVTQRGGKEVGGGGSGASKRSENLCAAPHLKPSGPWGQSLDQPVPYQPLYLVPND